MKMDLQVIGFVGMDWLDLAQNTESWRTLVNGAMNIRVP